MRPAPLSRVVGLLLWFCACGPTLVSDSAPPAAREDAIKSGEVCGNGRCGPSESCSSCPGDCGTCPYCGDGACNKHESCANCPSDCGPCQTYCGDQVCTGSETCFSCPKDCGRCSCGDGVCTADETCESCPGDCGFCGTGGGSGGGVGSGGGDDAGTDAGEDAGTDSGLPPGYCETPADCPPPSGPCVTAVCLANTCAEAFAPSNTPCGTQECTAGQCAYSDTCDEVGEQILTCTGNVCDGLGSCVAARYQQVQSCSRDTDGDVCGVTGVGCLTGTFRDVCCANGACTGSCGTGCL